MNQLWFGTRERMAWIAMPAIDVGASRVSWLSQGINLDGTAYALSSANGHLEYDFSWPLMGRDKARAITDFAEGMYGLGPKYWSGPELFGANALPQDWAAPFVGGVDGLVLNGDTANRPTLEATPANSNGYPTKTAIYTVGAGTKPNVWVPIPTGYTAWLGVHGVAGTGGEVVVTPTTGPTTTGVAQTPAPIAVTSTTRVNAYVDSTTADGVLVSLGGVGTVKLTAITVMLLPTGDTPATGGFLSGQGHGGCQFSGQPVKNLYSTGLDKVGLTAKLVETRK